MAESSVLGWGLDTRGFVQALSGLSWVNSRAKMLNSRAEICTGVLPRDVAGLVRWKSRVITGVEGYGVLLDRHVPQLQSDYPFLGDRPRKYNVQRSG